MENKLPSSRSKQRNSSIRNKSNTHNNNNNNNNNNNKRGFHKKRSNGRGGDRRATTTTTSSVDSNAVSQKHNGPKSGLKFGKPSGTPQGAVVISPAQLRAKSMKNSKHLKGRRKKSSPPIQGTRF